MSAALAGLPMWLAGTLLPLGALWLLFRGALRGERCFGYNRALLLLAPVVAAAWPLLPHPALPAAWLGPAGPGAVGPAVLLPTLSAAFARGAAGYWASQPWLLGLGWLYAAGVGVGWLRLAGRYRGLRRATRHLPRERRPGYYLAYTGGQLPTSSFGRTIFWDETAGLTPAEAAPVLAHELAHVRQGHSADVLWLESWRVLLWPNPFAHLLLPALRLTHELLADDAALAAPTPAAEATPSSYPALLARLATRHALGAGYSSLLQPFTFSFTLTRIAMLQNNHPVRRWKQWLVLPLLGGLFLAACQSTPLDKLAATPPPPPMPTPSADAPQSSLDPSGQQVYTYVDQMPQLPAGGGVQAIVQAIQDKLVYPQQGPHAEGRVFARFTVLASGDVHDATIVRGLSPAYDEAVLAAIRQLPTFVPGQQGGKNVSVSFTVPMLFKDKP